jgi:hypothetical protein
MKRAKTSSQSPTTELAQQATQAELDQVVERLHAMWANPQQRLARAAAGLEQVELRDIENLLASHVLQLDIQASTVAGNARGLVEMLFGADKKATKRLDTTAALDLVERLTKLHSANLSELRKTSDLLARLVRPQRPQIKVLAAVSAEQINVG